jgi:septum site-determining protein MinD
MSRGAVLAVHSYKGGTGKTLVSVNLASVLAKQGKNVCLVDLDLRAPSLNATFPANGGRWVNDFLDDGCGPAELLHDFSKRNGTKGKLLVAMANPSMETIREVVTKGRKWEMSSLRRLLSLKDFLLKDMGMDYVILDTGPGINYASINAVAVADLVLVVTTSDTSDASGTRGMVGELYDLLDKRTIVLMNKIPAQLVASARLRKGMSDRFRGALKLPVINILPCYCDVLRQDRSVIMALEKPKHPFSRDMVEVARHVEKIRGSVRPRSP